jgi:ABC-type transport system substrate-binding protein/predicted Ser/Thr protein kinase
VRLRSDAALVKLKSMQPEVRAGSVIAGFRVESLLGRGAVGTVYLAEQTGTGHRVALKLLAPELARDERFRRRFLRETELAATLSHPHVVRTAGSGEEGGDLYLAMDYVDGADLRELLRREGRLEPERAVSLVEQVAAALDAAHTAGLVHRDVKPGNILVAPDADRDHAYVCDFGLARHVSSVSSLTGERGFVGTIDYVPPEQIEGGTIDGRADVYSLGCVLYECLAGARPFDRESELSVVFAHLNEPPPRLSDVRPDLPEAFDAVFATALAKSPDERYSTCGELAAAAKAALRGKTFVRRRVRRRRLLLGGVAMLAVGGATVAGLLAAGEFHSKAHAAPGPSIALRPDALNLIDARTQQLVGRVDSKAAGFANGVGSITFSKTAAWVTTANQTLVRVSLRTRKVTRIDRLPWIPGNVAIGGGTVWVVQDEGQEVRRYDAGTGRLAGVLEIRGDPSGANADGVAYARGSLWISRGSTVARVDPRTGRVLDRIAAPSRYLLSADGAIWAGNPSSGQIWKIDPVEARVVHSQKLHGWLSGLAVGGGSVWAPIIPDGVVFRLSADDLGFQTNLPTGRDPESASFGDGQLWIANTASNSVSRLDDLSGGRRELRSQARPTTAIYHDGLVWTAAAAPPTPLPPIEGEELRVSTPSDSAIDPDPIGGEGRVRQLMYATCANLLYYPDSAGPAGTRLRPEIAAAMPTVSRDGRTYTFRIRPGYRFSPPSGEHVTAATFRHTLERALSPKNKYSAGPFLASDIRGVAGYRDGKAAHISGISAHGNALSITLVKPAGDFLTRISNFTFCPVPTSLPIYRPGFAPKPIPSAGPYYIQSIQGDRTVLERNPYYRGTRPRHAERIVYTNDTPTPKAVVLANHGLLDVLPQDFDNNTPLFEPGGALDQRKGPGSPAARAGRQQFYPYNAPLMDAIVFNTSRLLFRNAGLRRAVNYVLDRKALAAAYADAPFAGIVPPAVPGFGSSGPYPLTRSDVAAARRLAGRGRRHVVISICGDARLPRLAAIVRSDLSRIGMTTSVVASEQCPGKYRRADLLFTTIGSNELDPKPFVEQVLESSVFGLPLGPGPWRAAPFRNEVRNASALRGAQRLAAYRHIQSELMRMAPLAVFGSFVWGEYVSPKVGCRVHQAEFGFLDLGELCKPR